MNSNSNIILMFICLISYSCREEINEPIKQEANPIPPIGFRVYAAYDGSVGLEWQPVNASKVFYFIYRSTKQTSRFVYIKSVSDNYFIDTGLDYDSTYFYKISTFFEGAGESEKSESISATPKNINFPLRPSFVKVTAMNINNNFSFELSWTPSIDKDIKLYQVYRDTISFDVNNSKLPIGETENSFYSDSTEIKLLKKYYYRIRAVDRGGLTSQPTLPISDIVLNPPLPLSPQNKSEIAALGEFSFRSAAEDAYYKIIIQTTELAGIIKEYDLGFQQKNTVVKLNLAGQSLTAVRNYYWRVICYRNDTQKPNSISELFSFYLNP